MRPDAALRLQAIDGEPAFRRICEAVDAAQHSVWVNIAFIASGFLMPNGRGTVFDVLDAAARGLDVRVLFWRPNAEAAYVEAGATFPGTEIDRDFLEQYGSRFRARWDRAHGAFCQHQKSWLTDAGKPSEIAFVGGINPNPKAMVSPGHIGSGRYHDAYVEVAGPAATDVHHNFAQRWNEASERAAGDGIWGHDGQDDLAFPERLSQAAPRLRPSRFPTAGAASVNNISPRSMPLAIQSILKTRRYRSASFSPASSAPSTAAWKPWCYCQPSWLPGSDRGLYGVWRSRPSSRNRATLLAGRRHGDWLPAGLRRRPRQSRRRGRADNDSAAGDSGAAERGLGRMDKS